MSLFQSSIIGDSYIVLDTITCMIPNDDKFLLEKSYCGDDVKLALDSMFFEKALGLNGMTGFL